MQSKTKIGITLVVAIALSATILMFTLENNDENETTREYGVIDRVPASEQLKGIMRNNSECLNSIGGYRLVSGIFNETGESTAYINATGGQLYSVIIDTPNGTITSVEKVDRFPEWVYQKKTEVREIQR